MLTAAIQLVFVVVVVVVVVVIVAVAVAVVVVPCAIWCFLDVSERHCSVYRNCRRRDVGYRRQTGDGAEMAMTGDDGRQRVTAGDGRRQKSCHE